MPGVAALRAVRLASVIAAAVIVRLLNDLASRGENELWKLLIQLAGRRNRAVSDMHVLEARTPAVNPLSSNIRGFSNIIIRRGFEENFLSCSDGSHVDLCL